ncbi:MULTISPECIES: DUF6249 domain-containing protein [unclassified Arcicella]|uniref:DUF6249 domain-containing protein n=1 Tax=unclassified Arcicella TaxID=2644986 RepID=UPI002862948A|nr:MULTISPECIES: DUF6249 domain-containing protein [unclassified Arcicella]MDR6564505.1 hypothetical protein [Arcicella sp. BE51]MDR6814364.1 hypothetical protein [Arcicella sp. BE140]MDR6825614.1 hypothetical protein [Arcicella sp. BE139]
MENLDSLVPIVGIMVPIVAIIGTFTMIVFLRKYDNDEKMAMIAKGIAPPERSSKSFNVNPSHSLRWGFVLIGFGVGLLMGSLLESLINIDGDTAHFSMIFVFGGLGLLASYFYQMSLDKKNINNKD